MARIRPDFSTGFDGLDLETNNVMLEDGITAPDTVSDRAQIYVDTADGDLKVKFGDGTTKTITTDAGSGSDGKVVQIVDSALTTFDSTTTIIPLDDTIPQNTEGKEFITVSITPTSTSNKILLEAQLMAHLTDNTGGAMAFFRDSIADALAAFVSDNSETSADGFITVIGSHTLTAPSTSAITFKLRAGPTGSPNTLAVNGISSRLLGGVAGSYLRATEYIP